MTDRRDPDTAGGGGGPVDSPSARPQDRRFGRAAGSAGMRAPFESSVRSDRKSTGRSLPIVDTVAPARRLAAFRIAAGVFTVGYLLIRMPVFIALADRSPSGFEPVGILTPLAEPIPGGLFVVVIAVTVVSGCAFLVGAGYRFAAPVFAFGMLVLATFRSSWGQLLHFEHLMVLHLLVLAFAPAADAWSIDARRRRDRRSGSTEEGEDDGPSDAGPGKVASNGERSAAGGGAETASVRYGWPLAAAGLVTVTTYVIAGIAKLRYGGMEWMTGDTLRNHIAYSATRLDLIGGTVAPLAEFAVRNGWILPALAVGSVVLELAAPVAFVGGRIRDVWVAATWIMHMAIFVTMFVGFPSPLFGVAFAPFFHLERLARLPGLRRLARAT